MRRHAPWILLGTLFAAACGESTPPTGPDAPAVQDPIVSPAFGAPEEQGYLNSHIHVLPPKARNFDAHAAKPGGKPGSGTGISWHGGPVLHTVNVVAIYWGTSSPMYPGGPSAGTAGAGTGDASLIGTYLRGVGGSPYWLINTDYYDGAGKVTAAVSYTRFWAHNSNPGSAPSDPAIQNEIIGGFISGNLTYDPNTIYSVFTGPGVNLGGGFNTQYCAYHGDFTWNDNGTNRVVIYSAQPYNQGASGCMAQSVGPNGDPADPTVNTLAHEIEEAATDPHLNAWWDNRGYENADKCAWTWGTLITASNGAKYNMTIGGKNFLIQQNWLNRGNGGCALHL
jgi:hypothetical protein